MTYTRHGQETTGKPDVYYDGSRRVVNDRIEINDYDSAADGNGEAFDIPAEFGISRPTQVDVEVADGSAYVAHYDEVNGSIRLFALDGTGEVAAETTVNVMLRVEARGMG